jgi:hypothetical protein
MSEPHPTLLGASAPGAATTEPGRRTDDTAPRTAAARDAAGAIAAARTSFARRIDCSPNAPPVERSHGRHS